MKTGYRIERIDSEMGFFTGSGNGVSTHLYETIYSRHNNNTDNFPGYISDKELQMQVGYAEINQFKFMYPSMEILLSGFHKAELHQLVASKQFKVYEITATVCAVSKYQIVFKPESVTLKTDISHQFE